MVKKLAARQERSRKTEDALLRATVETLEAGGLEACTLPRVAAAAGVSAASVYRRFEDKDALLRAAFLKVLEQRQLAAAKSLEEAANGGGLEEAAERLAAALVQQHRAHPRLQRSLAQFAEAEADATFARRLREMTSSNLTTMAESLLRHRERIRHPQPASAAMFAVVMANATVAECVRQAAQGKPSQPLSDKQISSEVARAIMGYLRRKA